MYVMLTLSAPPHKLTPGKAGMAGAGSVRYVRTQVYLRQEQHHRLIQEAKSRGISLAELLRRIVDQHLHAGQKAPKEAYLSIVGIGEDSAQDVSIRHDKYLGESLAREHHLD